MDSNRSLTMLELITLLRSLGLNLSKDQIDAMLANTDSNDNSFVEFDELVDTILQYISAKILLNQEMLFQVFKCFNHDRNGFIIAAKLAEIMAKLGQSLAYRVLTEMIIEADTDGDGVISFNDFATVMGASTFAFLGFALS